MKHKTLDTDAVRSLNVIVPLAAEFIPKVFGLAGLSTLDKEHGKQRHSENAHLTSMKGSPHA